MGSYKGFPGHSVVKNPPVSIRAAGDVGSLPGSGRSLVGGRGNPLQDVCLENLWTGEPGRLQFTELQKSQT